LYYITREIVAPMQTLVRTGYTHVM